MTDSNNSTTDKKDPPPEKPVNKNITSDEMLSAQNELLKTQLSTKEKDELKYSAKQIDSFLVEGEVGDAELYMDIFRNKFCYDHIAGDWYYWNDHMWRMDILHERSAVIREIRKIYSIAKYQANFSKQSAEGKKDQKNQDEAVRQTARIRLLSDRINMLSNSSYYKKVIETASNGVGSLGIPGDNWDAKTKLLVVKNGCVDLVTGKFKPGNPLDYMRTYSPVELTKDNMDYSDWEKFLLSSLSGDRETMRFLQKLLGYSLLGTCEQHLFVIMHGIHGRNGKGTIFEVLFEALGNQMYKLPDDFLIKKRAQKADGAPDAVLMGMRGKKILWASELGKGDVFDMPKIKGIAGGDTVSARGQRAKHQTSFKATWLLWQLTNILAHVDSSDNAFWQRAIVIPFFKSFVPNPQKDFEEQVDFELPEKLKKILPAIVWWVIQGGLMYQDEGLLPYPPAVQKATLEYREGEDRIREFIEEYYTINADGTVPRGEMFKWYKEWCEESGYQKLGKKNFYKDIERRFGESKRVGNERFFNGLFPKSSYS